MTISITSLLRLPFQRLWDRHARFVLKQVGLDATERTASISVSRMDWDTRLRRGFGGWFAVPNHSGGYHGLLRQWWEFYGLGGRCLLVSESIAVRQVFEREYPATSFLSTDYFVGLGGKQPECDVVWNLCDTPTRELTAGLFSSIICQATLEHIPDPTGVLRRFSELMEPGAHLYIHTHTPAFPYHGYPRDYLRYFPDWFEDISVTHPSLALTELMCIGGHAFCLLKKA